MDVRAEFHRRSVATFADTLTLAIQAAKVLLMRPQNWPKFSFGPWLANAAPRMHRNKLAAALANKLAASPGAC